MTPNDYAKKIIVPTVKEFIDDPMNVRRMYLACITTYHICDYLGTSSGGPKCIQNKIEDICGADMRVIYEVCIGAKHAVPRNPNQFKAGDETLQNPVFDLGQ